MPILSRSFSPALLRDQHQYSCGDSIAFFGAQPLVYASVLADAHAEWQVVNHIAGVSLAGSESQRLDFGKSQAGPVAETAYRVLEHLLKVERRDHAELPHDALVTLGDEDGGLTGTVTVSYVFKLNRFFAKFYGKDLITITRTARRRIHESERN
jgi:hypothetical protein